MGQLLDIKHCPFCDNDLQIDKFGVCRARKDGRNLYCKVCINKKVGESRRAVKEQKAARKRFVARQIETAFEIVEQPAPLNILVRLSPVIGPRRRG